MGVVNATPDSFSGDGLYRQPHRAAALARRLERDGADILDVGAESTRPGASPISAREELERLLPALRLIRESCSLPISVDTSKASVATRALEEGAALVNDVSGLRDIALAREVAQSGSGMVLVSSGRVGVREDVVEAVRTDLLRLAQLAEGMGIDRDAILLDPGFGFGKNWRQNLEIVGRLGELVSIGRPVLIGPSRKGTVRRVLGGSPGDRLEGTLALVSVSAALGARVVRVHDVARVRDAVRMIDAVTPFPDHPMQTELRHHTEGAGARDVSTEDA